MERLGLKRNKDTKIEPQNLRLGDCARYAFVFRDVEDVIPYKKSNISRALHFVKNSNSFTRVIQKQLL